jgi:hypothetical protein
MKPVILPGEQITFFLKGKNSDKVNAYPVVATVLTVYRGAIVVADHRSQNGLAKIISDSNSAREWAYWYEYIDSSPFRNFLNVIELKKITGEQIKVVSFIED